jgi:D-serine deaminase-like pyridoxal phosphate-dependent protein
MMIQDLETPALCVDLDILEGNLAHMGNYVRQHGLRLRPHAKTHKIPEIGRTQIDSEAYGLTVAKSTEVAVMAGAEIDHHLLPYPAYGEAKLKRLTELALNDLHLTIAVKQLSISTVYTRDDVHCIIDVMVGLLKEAKASSVVPFSYPA